MIERVLKLDVGGRPISWITREEGALLYCRDQVAWEAGMEHIVLRGGYSRATRARSALLVSTIVAAHGVYRGLDLLNVVTACRECNHRKANMLLNECGHVYKDLDEVLRVLETEGIARVAQRMYPVANIKGAD